MDTQQKAPSKGWSDADLEVVLADVLEENRQDYINVLESEDSLTILDKYKADLFIRGLIDGPMSPYYSAPPQAIQIRAAEIALGHKLDILREKLGGKVTTIDVYEKKSD